MNFRMIGNIIGKVILVEAAFMLPALLISFFLEEMRSAGAFAATFLIMLLVALPMLLVKPKKRDIFAREGLVSVGLIWIIVSLLGALPYLISGVLSNYIDCIFETVSGFTTTGASVFTDVEVLPKGILYWRSFTNWLGGMGVLVFVLILNPLSSKNSGENMHILRAESPGVKISKLVPRMKQSASILYLIYIGLSLVLFILLLCGKVSVFESITLTFSTAGTGGFAVKNASVGAYGAYVQWIVGVFMLLFSVNFYVYFLCLMGSFRKAIRSEEVLWLFGVVVLAVATIAFSMRGRFESGEELMRTSFFQVASIVSTTGFGTADFDGWTQYARMALLALMFMGGCGGSTAGGLKVSRVIIALKSARRTVHKTLFPNSVELLQLEGERLDEETVNGVERYIAVYALLIVFGMLLVSVDGFSMETNISAAISCINNVGPGFDAVGPTANYAGFSAIPKLGLSLMMLIGRLELYPILALLSVRAWKK